MAATITVAASYTTPKDATLQQSGAVWRNLAMAIPSGTWTEACRCPLLAYCLAEARAETSLHGRPNP
jgi:hypothetical protein